MNTSSTCILLEKKGLMHAIILLNNFQATKKKVYMLYNLEPDRSVTGGAWYSDQDFESEFVDVLNQQCFKFLEQKVREFRKQNFLKELRSCNIERNL